MSRRSRLLRSVLLVAILSVLALPLVGMPQAASETVGQDSGGGLRLRSRILDAPADRVQALRAAAEIPIGTQRHVVLQLDRIPNASERKALEATGIKLVQYLSDRGWFATVKGGLTAEAISRVRGSWNILPADRLAPSLARGPIPAHAVAPDGRIWIEILAFGDADFDALAAEVHARGGTVDATVRPFDTIFASVPDGSLAGLAGVDGIQRIEPIAPPSRPEMNRARNYLNQPAVLAPPYSLTGAGVDVGVHDYGHAFRHTDYYNRWSQGDLSAGQPFSVVLHPTMTAGAIGGDGTLISSFAGMAPGANVVTYSYAATPCCEANNYSDIVLELQNGGDVANNSWGYFCDDASPLPFGNYTTQARVFDRQVLGMDSNGNSVGDPMVVVFSGGNERDKTQCAQITEKVAPFRNYGSINQPKPAKNPIVVGAVDSADDRMSSFSSWGPTSDGRLRPDIVAAGVHSGTYASGISELDNCFGNPVGASNQQCYRAANNSNTQYGGYAWFSETSAAAAMVSGNAALFIQDYRSTHAGANPPPSMVKAHFIHTARDLSDSTSWYNPGPDYASGYGLLNIQAAVDQLRSGGFAYDCVDNGQSKTITLAVPAGTANVKVTLVWDDVPGTPATTAPALVNDLDLVVTDASGVRRYPWTLNPASPAADAVRTAEDHLNNAEQVFADGSVPAGNWTVTVRGTAVPSGPQCYSLVYPPLAGGSCPEGAACDDGNVCTTNDTCSGGVCVGGGTLNCDDSVPCTSDSCNPGSGCVHAPTVCTPLDQCHDAGTCDAATGVCSNPPKADGTVCDDQDPNTGPDTCVAGVCQSPLVIQLVSFTATVERRSVRLDWTTASEIDTAGFRILRGRPGAEPQVISGAALIAPMGNEFAGASYTFSDTGRLAAGTVSYYLEDVDLQGNAARRGPVTITIPKAMPSSPRGKRN